MKTQIGGFVILISSVCWANTSTAATDIDPDEASHSYSYSELNGPLAVDRQAIEVSKEPQDPPSWLAADGSSYAANQLLAAIENAPLHGLDPKEYHLDPIRNLLSRPRDKAADRQLESLLTEAFMRLAEHLLNGRIDPREIHPAWPFPAEKRNRYQALEHAIRNNTVAETLAQFEPQYPQYERLKMALIRYREMAQLGHWPQLEAGPSLRLGEHDPRLDIVREQLKRTGDLIEPSPLQSSAETEWRSTDHNASAPQPLRLASVAQLKDHEFDESLLQAVVSFQQRHGLEPDGIIGPKTRAALNRSPINKVHQIEWNLERWRWLPESLGERYILVNIAGYEMEVYDRQQSIFQSPVIVGRPDRKTPILSSAINQLVLSPYWYVPYNIAVKDKLPMLRRDPYALSRTRVRIFSGSGREVDPGNINWHALNRTKFPYQLRQDPGRANALGKVKFLFPNRHQVYLHDTSSPRLFQRAKRAFSSGCIRVEKPLELAELLLRSDPDWDRERIDRYSQRRRQTPVTLPEETPVHLLYWTAWQDADGSVQFRDDIYDYDQRIESPLLTLSAR